MTEQNTTVAPSTDATEGVSEAEDYASDLAAMASTAYTSQKTVIPHMEILASQLQQAGATDELVGMINDLSSDALTNVATIQASITRVREVNDPVAQAHEDQPDAVTDKEYYGEA